MNQEIKVGDYVRLTHSSNPYVPEGSILKIESLSSITNSSGKVLVFNVIYGGRKYHVHSNCVVRTNYTEREKVCFT